MIALFDDSVPSGWTRFSSLDSRMPRGAGSYGGTGGSTTHTHSTTGGYNTSTVTGTTRKSGATASAGDHYHTTVAGNTDSANNMPTYLNMVFASIDSDGVGAANSIVIVSAVPPLGWSRFSSLDGSFPRGASSYGGTGGASSHTHSITIETGPPSSTSTAGGGLVDTATSTHTHSCTDTTDEQSNISPYLDVIYARRENPVASITIGDEESNGSGGGLQGSDTYSYAYSGDGERVIEVVSTTTVITTVFIGNYYEFTITDTGTITKSYYYAGQTRVAMRDNGTLYFLLSDHLGSTSLTTDRDGNRVSETRYSPWGSIRYMDGTIPTDFTFTGQKSETESFGLMFYGARWYDPRLIGFNQPDTIIPDHYNPLDYNRYAYVRSNPLKYSDPSGNLPCSSCEIASLIYFLINIVDVKNVDPIKKGRVAAPSSPEQVDSWMVGVLNTNVGSEYTKQMRSDLSNIYDPTGMTNATKTWVSLVRSGAIWDFKPDLNNSDALISGSDDVMLGKGKYKFDYQAIANIHYGYVGTAAGFNSIVLQVGAGLFQDENSRGNIKTFFDDPFDNYWILFGIYLYTEFGDDELTEDEFLLALDQFIEKNGDPGTPINPAENQNNNYY